MTVQTNWIASSDINDVAVNTPGEDNNVVTIFVPFANHSKKGITSERCGDGDEVLCIDYVEHVDEKYNEKVALYASGNEEPTEFKPKNVPLPEEQQ
ncbi:hypothetical protein FQA39_LY10178 [Lamprigera yunnana]|nr:hypothetical protein FQA39_LY10178 [Lamprigera yunnana]